CHAVRVDGRCPSAPAKRQGRARERRAPALRRGPRARDPRARRGAARREPSRLARAGEGGPGPGAPRRRGIRRARARPGARRAGHRAPARDRPAGALLGRHRAGPRRGDREDGSRPGVKRVAYRLFRSTASFQYRLGRQLTPAGKLVLAALGAAGVIGFDTNRTVGYQAFTLLAALLVVAAAWSVVFRVRLDIQRVLPRFVTAGAPAVYRLVIRNGTVRPQRGLVLLEDLALPGVRKYQRGGVALAGAVGDSEEFVSLRDYRPGDPLRRVHWRSAARVGRPVVKEYQDEFFVRHALVLDTFAEREESDVFEEAVSVAASIACSIQTKDSLLDLLFVGPETYCFTAGRGLGHTDHMLEVLA